jgi:hypothetical protein
MPPLLSIIVLNWNTRDLLAQCLGAVLRFQGEAECEVMVVDNASTDDSLAMLAERFPQVQVIYNTHNVGFAGGNNRGVAACAGKYALLLNTDAFLGPDALRELVRVAESDPRTGVVGAHLLDPDGTFQASYTPFPTLWREFLILSGLGRAIHGPHYPSAGPDEGRGAQKVDYVEGACLLVNVEAYRAMNGLDEGFFMYAEEVDLCYTMRKHGWNVWYAPGARVTHLGGASSANRKPEREADLYRGRVQFFRKHYGMVSAGALKAMIFFFTAAKVVAHGLARWASGGRVGRRVVSLGYLAERLRGV